MPAGHSEKVFEQDRAYFTYIWKATVSSGIWTIFLEGREILQTGLQNLAKFSAENSGP